MYGMGRADYNLSNWQYGAAGAITGVTTRFTCQPFDVLKIRFQVQLTPTSLSSQPKYRSIPQAVKTIVTEEGIFAMWKGHMPAQILSAAYGAIQFSTYEAVSNNNSLPFIHFFAGAISGASATIGSFPFDVIRTRMVAQGEPKVYQNMLDAGMQIAKTEGWRGFYRGLLPSCIQTAPLSGLIFGFNNLLTTFLKSIKDQTTLSAFELMVCGGTAGFSGKMFVYPFDLAKKRMQIQGMPIKYSAVGPTLCSTGLYDCLRMTLVNEGFRGLYKGLTPSLLKSTFASATYLTTYDLACKFFQYYR